MTGGVFKFQKHSMRPTFGYLMKHLHIYHKNKIYNNTAIY